MINRINNHTSANPRGIRREVCGTLTRGLHIIRIFDILLYPVNLVN